MRSIEVANMLVSKHGATIRPTNLSLNKLVYFAQVESLKMLGRPLFCDRIEAWEYGPVEPEVYHAFKGNGRRVIARTAGIRRAWDFAPDEETVVDAVAEKYGRLGAFDLVRLTHRDGGAWSRRYTPGMDAEITAADIIASDDYASDPDMDATIAAGFQSVREKWPNTLRMLEDA